MKKEKENPNHHMGKYTGYELINGEYHIADQYTQAFYALNTRAESIKRVVRVVSDNAAEQLKDIVDAEHKLWKDIQDDIGIYISKAWQLKGSIIKEKKND
jgi:DNA replication protein DnaD